MYINPSSSVSTSLASASAATYAPQSQSQQQRPAARRLTRVAYLALRDAAGRELALDPLVLELKTVAHLLRLDGSARTTSSSTSTSTATRWEFAPSESPYAPSVTVGSVTGYAPSVTVGSVTGGSASASSSSSSTTTAFAAGAGVTSHAHRTQVADALLPL